VILYLDGGSRNFYHLQSVSVQSTKVQPERSYGDLLPKEGGRSENNGPLFMMHGRTRKNYKGLILCAVYKSGWDYTRERPVWTTKCFYEPVHVTSSKEKVDLCTQLAISSVPALEKFRPRLFSSIRDLCAALSSHSLPKLKKKFQKTEEGLPIGQFTEVLFKQLYETHPKIIEEGEAPYTVAMLQEMFHQIDFNGDGSTSWDEFTSFCIQTGLSAMQSRKGLTEEGNSFSLDQYVIEYGEEILQRDHILSAYRLVSVCRYIPEARKLLIISEDADNVLVLDEKFRLHSQIYPTKLQVIGTVTKTKESAAEASAAKNTKSGNNPRSMIYDIIYLSGRDMLCFSSSDHSITICKELGSIEGMRVNYLQYNRFYHTLLHLKLCWSQKHDLLCSTASDRVIYGWNIDTAQILFQISRHSDIITEFISVDHIDCFITASMDRRIVLWSSTSRRVKGVLLGHKRGIRCLSYYENTLLSAAFECDARTWDLASKDCVAILKGHRHPIVAAKLMCDKAPSEKEYRAITVDEVGEFRVWNIYVRERGSDPVNVPTIQIFEMQNPETPLNQFRFLAMPYNPRCSTSYYSDLIACSTKLLHFLPEKNTKEFVPPTAIMLNESASTIVTAVGKSILTYDLSSGEFTNNFEAVCSSEIFAFCSDGEHGKRLFVGTGKGELLLVNSVNGAIIDQCQYHTKEITAICQKRDQKNSIFTCSMDGNLRMFEENGGQLHLQISTDCLFGEGIGITAMKNAPSVHIVVIVAAGNAWGLVNDTSFKKLLIIHEDDIVTTVEILGASRDKMETDLLAKKFAEDQAKLAHTSGHHDHYHSHAHPPISKENILTLAVALTRKINIYAVDTHDLKGCKTFELVHETPFYITDLIKLESPDIRCVNYSSMKTSLATGEGGHQLIGVTDDGKIIVWDTDTVRFRSDEKFKQHYQYVPKGARAKKRMELLTRSTSDVKLNAGESTLSPPGSPDKDFADNYSLDEKDSTTVQSFLTSLEIPGQHDDHQSQGGSEIMPLSRKSPHGRTLSVRIPRSPAGRGKTKMTWVELSSKEFFPIAFAPSAGLKNKKLTQQSINAVIGNVKAWVAHDDMVPAAIPLHAHGCFVTVSHDGFHRIWNLDADCLGELPLPNMTEQMKSATRCKEPGTQWKFILEQIPISKHHIDIANLLVKQLKQTRQEKMADQQRFSQDRRHVPLPLGFKGFRESTDVNDHEETEKDRLRKNILGTLNDPPKVSEEVPPSRLPTKEEKEIIKMSLFGTMDGGANQGLNGGGSQVRLGNTLDKSSVLKEPSLTNSITGPPSLTAGGLTSPSWATSPQAPTRAGGSRTLSPIGTRPMSKEHKEREIKRKTDSLKSSMLLKNDSSVCMSCFGLPSVWVAPGEKDIFGNSVMKANSSVPEQPVPAAFSDQSIAGMLREGLIDAEGHRILRKIAGNTDRIEVYDRSQPILLIRNPAMSTSISLPALESVRKTEISFGAQKDMYKNAEKVLNEKSKISKTTVRNAVAMTRIDQNVRHINSMIHVIQPPSHDEVILPKNTELKTDGNNEGDDELGRSRTDDNRMRIRLMKSAALVPVEAKVNERPLDRESVDRWTKKLSSALEYTERHNKDNKRLKKKKREVISQAQLMHVEQKLCNAIRAEYRQRTGRKSAGGINPTISVDESYIEAGKEAGISLLTSNEPIPPSEMEGIHDLTAAAASGDEDMPHPSANTDTNNNGANIPINTNPADQLPVENKKPAFNLTTRQLLPYYRLESVHQFMDIFAKVDENFSGDLDVNEWIRLFTSLNESIPAQEARMIFMKIDKDGDGFLSIRELIPVVFNKATREQLKLIVQYAELELTKKIEIENIPKVSTNDLEFLFEAYDMDNVGFVDVSLIKERIRNMRLSENALFFFMELIGPDLADDEMVNLVEFKRLFKPFSNAKK
jgi:WD40 repeat protein